MIDREKKVKDLQQKDRMDRFVQLKLYEHRSVMPNLAAKSMLFRPTAKGRRPHFPEWEPVPVVNLQNVELFFRFTQLDQVDLTGWLVLVQLAKSRDDLVAAFTMHEFLKRMGKGRSQRDYAWLTAFLDRITGTQVRVAVAGEEEGRQRGYVHWEALAPRAAIETQQELVALELSKALWKFFGLDSWSYIDMETRLALGQNQWAMAFQAFLAANKSPLWTTWADLHTLWGAGYTELRKFKYAFQERVLGPLVQVGAIKGADVRDTSVGIFWDKGAGEE